ncbi:MAG: beta-ketoacyl-[acyl-carrier-protein] synthase family protein [Eubacteriales bacterium]|nr:beta-ketoacyl-[acyl-carrier-protein] synthase family protein [Eubacteriales bacterium]MDD4121453.1 beta-ketoacyl-[acyl-carrier-protein] synthase family protein [Eubacteriales bacterium]MDD4629651.1 beta-ketoacyl-[acyl-carrier-protein] synthase family protein [Eubacteriales bacterium]
MEYKNVVVTGLGIIAPGSLGKEEFWQNTKQGIVFTGALRAFDHKGIRCPVSAEIVNTEAFQALCSSYQSENLSRTQLLACMAADLALNDSRLSIADLSASKVHIAAGSTMGIEDTLLIQNPADLEKTDPAILAKYTPVHIIDSLKNHFQLSNPTMRLYMNACAAGNYAIGNGFDEVRSGRSSIAIVGGVDALSYLAIVGFNRLLSVTPDLCRPFDKNRKGIVVAEGSAFLILEDKEHALQRNAQIYAKISGYGLGVDAYHITSPSPGGRGAIQAMRRALNSASLIGDDIDYVSAHGTGTAANDAAESKALIDVFEKKLPPMSSIKSMIGHTMGAASAIEAAACCLMIKNQEILPTANYTTPDEKCPIDCVPNKSRKAPLNHVMSNALAFGGNNSSVIFSKSESARSGSSNKSLTALSKVNKYQNDSIVVHSESETKFARILFTYKFECDDLDQYFLKNLPDIDIRMVDRQAMLLTAAIWDAMKDRNIEPSSLPSESTAIVTGSNLSALMPSINFLNSALEKGALGTSPMMFPNTVGNAPASRASIWLCLRDKVICLSDGPLLSGLDALLAALEEVNKDSKYAWACSLEDDSAVVALTARC